MLSVTDPRGAPVLTTQTMTKPVKLENGLYSFVIQLFLLLRIESKDTDVLVTVNVPKAERGSMAKERDPTSDPKDHYLALGKQMLESFVQSFKIVDWGFLGE